MLGCPSFLAKIHDLICRLMVFDCRTKVYGSPLWSESRLFRNDKVLNLNFGGIKISDKFTDGHVFKN